MTTVNKNGEPLHMLFVTIEEMDELILLIDDEPVDEDLLRGIRRKLVAKRKKFRRKVRAQSDNPVAQAVEV